MKKRIIYIFFIIIASVLGIGSRMFSDSLPDFVANFAGDTFWAFAVYFIVRFILLNLKILKCAIIAFSAAVLIELSQLYSSDWIDSIRQTVIGGLILGFGFLWSDFICYFVGIMIGTIVDLLVITKIKI